MAEENKPIVLTFSGGINARQRSADINIEECTEGENFNLDFQSAVLAPRQGLAIRATAPNGEPIRGIAQLVKQDGTLSTIVQAGGTVYSWDGTATGFIEIGTVSPDSRLRGPIDSNFTLDNFIIITDLAKIENVKKWTGEVFTDLEHNLGVDFKAKYVTVQTERAIFANVKTGTVDTPHVILASKQGDSEVLTSTIRPAAAASAEDEWFLPTPDLHPINGITFFAKTLLLSTERGRLYALEGLIAGKDVDGLPFTSIQDFHAGSAVSGDEAMVNIGNDVALGLPGRIETLRGIIEFGDVETNDASWWIAPLIDGTFGKTVSTWKLIYDPAGQRVFCFPNNEDTAWVLHKHLLFGPNRATFGKIGKNISPWSKWTTAAIDGLRVTAIGVIFDPTDSPALISTSPGASFTSFSGGTVPTIFFGVGGSEQPGSLFFLKREPVDTGIPQWIIVGDDGKLATSPDGIIWTIGVSGVESPSDPLARIQGIAKGDDIWVGVVRGGRVIFSTDLINWSNIRLFNGDVNGETFQDVIWWPDQNEFVAVSQGSGIGDLSRVWTSTNGIDWIVTKAWTNDPAIEFRPEEICHDGSGLLFAPGDDGSGGAGDGGVARSTDAITWTIVNALNDGTFTSCTSDLTTTMAIGGSGDTGASEPPVIRHSTDGIIWTLANDPGWSLTGAGNITGMGFGNDVWLAGSGGQVATSSDAANWTLVTTPFTGFVRDFEFSSAQSLWVAVESNGKIATSPDGTTWTERSSPFGGDDIHAVAVSA